uniref:Uncharacterized protein n=1 Tax=Calcidiscus leptoporus TaxID=127549 RepID=A0A7S0NW95_9EUKA|mmetsp:Transcript_32826/g.76638  ORF Transcript_32826/g.76638 Transcript_32826/m.76638 type:complete len:399 (+) Transcript_32826:86-1282(+)
MVRTESLTCAILRRDSNGIQRPFIILEVLYLEYFSFGGTRLVAIDPCDMWPNRAQVLEWREKLVGCSWISFNTAAQQINALVSKDDVPVDYMLQYQTYMVPLDTSAYPFPWNEFGSRQSSGVGFGDTYQVRYSPTLAMYRVATFASDCHPEGHPLAGQPRDDGQWVRVGECRPFVPLGLSDTAAQEGLARSMPGGRYRPHVRPRDRLQPGEIHELLSAKTKKKRPLRKKDQLRVEPGCIIFLAPPQSVTCSTAPSCVPLKGALMHHPVQVIAHENNHAPPRQNTAPKYLVVESTLGGDTWLAHVSQALSFTNNFATRWRMHAEMQADEVSAAEFRNAMGVALDRAASRSFSPPSSLLKVYFAIKDPCEGCEGTAQQSQVAVPSYLERGEWREKSPGGK